MTVWLIRVEGQVQQVGFRDFAVRTARELNVNGTVRNLADGAVEIIAQGDREAVEALTARVRAGPPAADVTAVITEPVSVAEEPDSFEVGQSER